MIGKESSSKGSVSLHDVFNILESRRKQKNPIYEQEMALEHAGKFEMTNQQYEKMRKRLGELGSLKDETVTKLIDIRPKNESLLRHVLTSERRNFSSEELQSILAITKEA